MEEVTHNPEQPAPEELNIPRHLNEIKAAGLEAERDELIENEVAELCRQTDIMLEAAAGVVPGSRIIRATAVEYIEASTKRDTTEMLDIWPVAALRFALSYEDHLAPEPYLIHELLKKTYIQDAKTVQGAAALQEQSHELLARTDEMAALRLVAPQLLTELTNTVPNQEIPDWLFANLNQLMAEAKDHELTAIGYTLLYAITAAKLNTFELPTLEMQLNRAWAYLYGSEDRHLMVSAAHGQVEGLTRSHIRKSIAGDEQTVHDNAIARWAKDMQNTRDISLARLTPHWLHKRLVSFASADADHAEFSAESDPRIDGEKLAKYGHEPRLIVAVAQTAMRTIAYHEPDVHHNGVAAADITLDQLKGRDAWQLVYKRKNNQYPALDVLCADIGPLFEETELLASFAWLNEFDLASLQEAGVAHDVFRAAVYLRLLLSDSEYADIARLDSAWQDLQPPEELAADLIVERVNKYHKDMRASANREETEREFIQEIRRLVEYAEEVQEVAAIMRGPRHQYDADAAGA